MSKWNELSMAEKAEMMKVAVRQGITNLSDIRQRYNEFAEGGSKEEEEEVNTEKDYINTMERVAEENYRKWGYDNSDEALLHALNDNTYNYRGYYEKYPQSAANADTHWPDEFKTVYHPTFSRESIYSGKKSQYNPNGRVGGFWLSEDLFVPAPWQLFSNYAEGGGIHIKPSHRGRLTELKKRTGKSEAELYRTGSAATRKMITFARNARKWKHSEGGPLFTDNLFLTGGPKRQAAQVRPVKKNRFEDMSIEELEASARAVDEYWEQQQRELKSRTPGQIRQIGIDSDRRYRQEHPEGGKANPALQRAANLVVSAMQQQAPITGEDIRQAAEEQRQEKLDKWGDYKKGINATITAAELGLSGASLLGAYANWKNWATAANATKRGIANLLQRAQLPMQVGGTLIDGYQTYDALQNNDNFNANYNGASAGLGVAGSVGASDIFLNSRLHSPKVDRVLDAMGVIQNSGDFIKFGYDSMFGNEKAEGGSIHIKPENRGKFTALKERTGHSATWFKEHGTPAQKKMATFALNSRHWKHGLGGNLFEGGGRKLEYHPEGDYYYGGIPFKVTVTGKNKKKRPYWVSPKGAGNTALTIGDLSKAYTAATAGLLPNPISAGINLSQGKMLNALEDIWLYNSAHSEDPNVNYGVVGFSAPEGSLFSSMSKAAKATPKQWTAAQDAAIARGDMAEAQRLRDLHFKISAPKTEVVDINGNPQLVVHKTPETFTVFDNSRSIGKLNWFATPNAYGENGVFATGAGKNPRTMKLYVNMRNAHKPTIDEGIEPAYINQGEDGLLGIVDKDMTNYFKSSRDAGKGFMMSGGVDNPNALKSADAVTYDDKGVRIPLGKRDNFNINDIRYGLLPFGIGLTGYGLLNNQEAFGGNIKKRKR